MLAPDRARISSRSTRFEATRAPLTLPELVKFTALAALLAMFGDAAVAHAMLWGNDPYWTYWVTDALLMATVFGVGTAWIGVGLKRGAVLTFVHILLLTTYYWTLAPIGLPGQPEWLDLEHTWLTGLPVHFGIYYLGYVLAVWLWDRARRGRTTHPLDMPAKSLGPTASLAMALAVAIVILLGLLQTWVTGQFPGLTWFIMRIAVTTPLLLAWWAAAGTDRIAAISGGVMVGFALTAYSHYLAPMGLPDPSFRLLAENPPSAQVQWLSYREAFLILLPSAQVLAIIALLLASRWRRRQPAPAGTPARPWPVPLIGFVVLALIGLGAMAFQYTGPEANRRTISAAGPGAVERGTPFGGDLVPAASASLAMTVENSNTHRTPLPPHDKVEIKATVTGANGSVYTIEAKQPMIEEPRGRHTTWAGVGFDKWHHGRSGIGTDAFPATRSDIAVFALGNISSAGKSIATDVPVNVLTSSRPDARLELHVGDPAAAIADLPDGHLRVVWANYSGSTAKSAKYARYALGTGVLLVLLGFAIALARRDAPQANSAE